MPATAPYVVVKIRLVHSGSLGKQTAIEGFESAVGSAGSSFEDTEGTIALLNLL
jgi:hypothetical protein